MRQKSWQSLLFKVRHLSLEVEDRQELIRENSAEFERRVLREIGDPVPAERSSPEQEIASASKELARSEPVGDLPPPADDQPEAAVPEGIPDAVRRLWKAVALKSHPDRVGSDGELGRLYRVASAAWTARDFAGLLGVALELGLAIEPDEALGKALAEIVSTQEKRLAELEQMAIWQWIQADPASKPDIVKRTSEIVAARRP